MKYFKRYKECDAKPFEVTKEEAKRTLEGYWEQEALDDIFEKEKPFRLWTPYAEVWTRDKNGLAPMAGFIGVIE